MLALEIGKLSLNAGFEIGSQKWQHLQMDLLVHLCAVALLE